MKEKIDQKLPSFKSEKCFHFCPYRHLPHNSKNEKNAQKGEERKDEKSINQEVLPDRIQHVRGFVKGSVQQSGGR